ncbi:MAG: histidine kinase, partial [Flavisolibacter sp.]
DKNIFTRPDFLPEELFDLTINLIYCDSDGNIWIATRDPFGLYHYNMRNNQFRKIKNDITRHFETLGESSRISTVVDDKSGNIWMSSRLGGGIIRYEKKKDLWKLYPPAGRNFNSLANKGVVCLYAGNNNFLWFSNYFGDGLIRYDYINDSIRQFTRHDGLPENYVLNITSDNAGNLWLTYENGLTQFNPATLQSQYSISFSGLETDDQHVVTDSLNNTMVVSLNDRLLFIPASPDLVKNSFPHPVIDKISVNNKLQFIDPQNQQLSLSHDQKNISIDFTAVQPVNRGQIHFVYRLTGVDEEWIYADANRTEQYSILSPGNYTFQLKASNERDIWNSAPAVFAFSIAAPWWQTIWFRITALLCVIGLISLAVRKRISTIRHEAEMKQKIAETEMTALRAQMNPHFIFNCLNSIDNLIQNGEKEKATTYLAKFAKLIRAILENSKSNTIPCWKDLETLKLYLELEEFRCDKKFSYQLNIASEILQGDYKVPPMIIQPYVENAILHGLLNKDTGTRRLAIDVSVEKNHINYSIEDTGIGRKQAEVYKQLNKPNYQSMGLDITRDRINLFNQRNNGSVTITDLYNENKEATGTKVEVHLLNQS